MTLFEAEPVNLLPYDGLVTYHERVFNETQAKVYYDGLLQNIAWKNDEVIMFGKRIITKRKVAWYGSKNFAYTYSKIKRHALPWTKELLELKQVATQMAGVSFNSCLLNLYHTGEEAMGWHSDDEKELERHAPIVSLSFGADRKFMFKHKKTGETVSLLLKDGSMLVMKDATQTNWLHRLPPTKTVLGARINLTFRIMAGATLA